ncbi:MAG: hypothetical protein A2283_22210 [Lentisphaerae bacterium RIFOXYA12_FULL_48_11]|nr:MAG: hypothetical protein A2283_22210 [Lentisphaerae bacterium RIFOXYA12_FULL_48_11]
MKKCVFFDRDGIINKSPGPGYVERWADFHLMPEIPGILKLVKNYGYEAVVVTNQRGVATGVMTLAALEEIHGNLQKQLDEDHHLALCDILYCVHGEGECECRKPKPGMLLEAAKRHNIDLKLSWMIGDNEKDVEAGRRAGCRTILVAAGKPVTKADYFVPDMKSLELLLRRVLEEGNAQSGKGKAGRGKE